MGLADYIPRGGSLKLEIQGLADFGDLPLVFVNPFADVEQLNELVKTTIDPASSQAMVLSSKSFLPGTVGGSAFRSRTGNRKV